MDTDKTVEHSHSIEKSINTEETLLSNSYKDRDRTKYLLYDAAKKEQSDNEPEHNCSRTSSFVSEQHCKCVEECSNLEKCKCANGDGIPTSGSDDKKDEKSLNFMGMSRKDKATLLLLMASHFAHTFGYSLMGPFFPIEAEKKGVSTTVTGFIFSCFELFILLSSPFFGAYLTRIGVNFAFTVGLFVTGFSTILFGVLNLASADAFVPLCFIVRAVEALGISSYSVASYAIASKNFQRCISQVFGLMETCLGVGLMVGPVFGSLLYQAAGYGLPFYLLGSFVMLMGVLTFFFFPTQDSQVKEHRRSGWYLLKSGQVWVTALTISVSAYGYAFLDPNLSLHAKEMNIPSTYSALLFTISPVLYAVTSPLWGWITDKKGLRASLMIVGNVFCGISFLLMGPTPYLPFLPSAAWLLIVGLGLNGIFVGCALMPTISCLLKGAEEVGFPDNMETFAQVSGFFTTFYCSGSFLGPFTGGILVDHLGFDYSTNLVCLLYFVATIACIAYYGWRYRLDRQTGSYVKFLDSNTEGNTKVEAEDETEKSFSHRRRSLSIRYVKTS